MPYKDYDDLFDDDDEDNTSNLMSSDHEKGVSPKAKSYLNDQAKEGRNMIREMRAKNTKGGSSKKRKSNKKTRKLRKSKKSRKLRKSKRNIRKRKSRK